MCDDCGPVVTDSVYDHLLPSSPNAPFDSSEAALALNKAVRSLRDEKFPLAMWVPFVHMGV
jgi:hypothetical protein